MKKQISNIAAIINANDDLQLIQDRAIVIPEYIANKFNIEQIEADLAVMADYSTKREEDCVRRILQLMTHYEQYSEEFLIKKYRNASILFTITVFDDVSENIRNIVIDTKVFRKHVDMLHFANRESTRMYLENLMKRNYKAKTQSLSLNT